MPSNQNPIGALPARFRRPRLLIVGCGDVGLRAVEQLCGRLRILALTSSPLRIATLRGHGVVPLRGDLDDARTLRRLAGLATYLLHLAPPAPANHTEPRDRRTEALSRALRLRTPPIALTYASTSGVYGDRGGARVDETHAPRAATPRALRRLDAEAHVRHLARSVGVRANILRIPGIYALDRVGGDPRDRLEKGTPVLQAGDDVYTNHIHADDLARACIAALWRGRPQRVYNISDDSGMLMGDYFDLAADLHGLPRPPRISREEAHGRLRPMAMSFLSESRRLDNTRMKQELRLVLHHPHVRSGLSPAPAAAAPSKA